jgi:hypothetical protein
MSAPGFPRPVKTIFLRGNHSKDVRRILLQQEEKSYGELTEFISKIYTVPVEGIILRYEDDEGDLISISSQRELQEAFRLCDKLKRPLLKVAIALAHDDVISLSSEMSRQNSEVRQNPQQCQYMYCQYCPFHYSG